MPFDNTAPARRAGADDTGLRLRTMRLDAAASGRLRALKAVVEGALPQTADRFYRFFGQIPVLSALLGSAERVARLRVTQADHWKALFNGSFDGAYFARAARIGATHARIGLEPRWYIAGYCLMLESLIDVLVRRHRAKPALTADIEVVLRAAFLDMDLALSTYQKNDEADRMQGEMNGLADVLERELQMAVGEISVQTERLEGGAAGLTRIAGEMRGMTQEVHRAIDTTAATVGTVASASQQLEAASREITGQVDRAATVSTEAVEAADATGQIMATLSRSVDQINGVVRLVQSIAQQTKLLALNATIEAARAGEAGRGFAGVASEVKELARQTEEAIGTVNAQAREILRATEGAATSVAAIGARIRSVSEIAEGVASSAGQQREATAEIARSVALAAENTGTVAARTRELTARATATEDSATLLRDFSGRVSASIADLAQRLTMILRNSSSGSRRRDARVPMGISFRLTAGEFAAAGWTGDLSPNGALLSYEAPDSLAGTDGEVELEGIGRLRARVLAASPIGIHIMFRDVGAAEAAAIVTRIAREHQQSQPYIKQAQDAAASIAAGFEAALASGQVTRAALFDTNYRPIEGSDPPQVLTDAVPICDRVTPPVIEPVKQSDEAVVFCAACDANGYIATHNRVYSEAPRPGQRDWNMANSRNRRIFDDRNGLLAARNRAPILIQAYQRDMGGGTRVMLQEFDAPIVVSGAHWGAVRLAVKMSP